MAITNDDRYPVLTNLIERVSGIEETYENSLVDETIRQENEALREVAETERKSAEAKRLVDETGRINAENLRNQEFENIKEDYSLIQDDYGVLQQDYEGVQADFEQIQSEFQSIQGNVDNTINQAQSQVTEMQNSIDGKLAEANNVIDSVESDFDIIETDFESISEEYQGIRGSYDDYMNEARVDMQGKEHKNLTDRINSDMAELFNRANGSKLIPYEGGQISASDSNFGMMKDFIIEGKTYQNLVGNLVYVNDGALYENGVLKFLKADTRISFNNDLIKENTVYTVIFNIIKNTLSEGAIKIVVVGHEQAGSQWTHILPNDIGLKVIKLNGGVKTASDINVWLRNGSIGEVEFNNFMVLEGDHTQDQFLPNYFEGIVGVGDKSKNLFGEIINGYPDGNIINRGREETKMFLGKVKPNTKYIVSEVSGSYNRKQIVGMDVYPVDSTPFTTLSTSFGSFTTGSNTNYVGLYYTNDINVIGKDFIAQMEEGTTSTPYEPYYDGYKIDVESVGKNILKKNSFKYPFYIPKNTLLTITTKNSEPSLGGNVMLFDINDNVQWFAIDSGQTSKTIRVNNDIYSMRNTLNGGLEHMVEIGNISTNFEPYKQDTYKTLLTEPLMQLPNGVADTIEGNKLIRRVGKIVFDGSEYWGNTGYGGHETRNTFEYSLTIEPTGIQSRNINTISDKFIAEYTNALPSMDNAYRITHSENVTGSKYYFLFCPSTDIIPYRDTTKWKEWLQANPTTVFYELAEPIITEVDETFLKSFDEVTHINSLNNVKPNIIVDVPTREV